MACLARWRGGAACCLNYHPYNGLRLGPPGHRAAPLLWLRSPFECCDATLRHEMSCDGDRSSRLVDPKRSPPERHSGGPVACRIVGVALLSSCYVFRPPGQGPMARWHADRQLHESRIICWRHVIFADDPDGQALKPHREPGLSPTAGRRASEALPSLVRGHRSTPVDDWRSPGFAARPRDRAPRGT